MNPLPPSPSHFKSRNSFETAGCVDSRGDPAAGGGFMSKMRQAYARGRSSYLVTVAGTFLLVFLLLIVWRPSLVRRHDTRVNIASVLLWSVIMSAVAFFIQWKLS